MYSAMMTSEAKKMKFSGRLCGTIQQETHSTKLDMSAEKLIW